MEASKKTKKIIFKKSQACVFMLQGITIGDTEHLIGSSADCWIFLYDLSGEAYSDQPKAQSQTLAYPINNASYSSQTNNLVCGTVGGAIYLFRNFSKTFFKDSKCFQTSDKLSFDKFCICTYWQNGLIYSINYPMNVFRIDPVTQADSEVCKFYAKFEYKISTSIFFNPPSGNGPHIAINFIEKKDDPSPALFNNMDDCKSSMKLSQDDPEEDVTMSTCMCYSAKTNEIVVGNYRGEVLIYSIVAQKNSFYSDLKVVYNFSDQKLVLQVQCLNYLCVLNLVKIRWIGLDNQSRQDSKNHPDSVDNVFSLCTYINPMRMAIGTKTLKIIKDAPESKECKFRVLDLIQKSIKQ